MKRKCKTAFETAIVDGYLYFEEAVQCDITDPIFTEMIEEKTLTSIRLISLSSSWQQRVWLDYSVSIIEQINMEMTLRKEKRGQLNHWYAYRRVLGRLHKRYVGTSEQVTEKRLLEIAQKMPSV